MSEWQSIDDTGPGPVADTGNAWGDGTNAVADSAGDWNNWNAGAADADAFATAENGSEHGGGDDRACFKCGKTG